MEFIPKSFQEFLTAKDLVKLGLFPSEDAAYLQRREGKGPPYIKMDRKILYARKDLDEWLAKHRVNTAKVY